MTNDDPSDLGAYLRQRMEELGIDSIRQLAVRVGVAYETARRLVGGRAVPDEATLAKVAQNLPAPLGTLRRLAGRPTGELQPFVLPPEADQLDERQRAVVLAMVRALLEASSRSVATLRPVQSARLVGRRRPTDG